MRPARLSEAWAPVWFLLGALYAWREARGE